MGIIYVECRNPVCHYANKNGKKQQSCWPKTKVPKTLSHFVEKNYVNTYLY